MKFRENKQLYFDLANCIRVLTADAVEEANSGHPGMPLGMADIMTVLAFDCLQYNPQDPKWFNRDRLILSNGHGSMLLYAFYYLTGYQGFTLEDIKNFRTAHSKTPGHPEYGAYSAIETTTGPLGQGFANAVGMAIAEKKYRQKYGDKYCNHKIYCTVGDGCLMEGISYEAAALAGHLGLNNLIVLFDDNHITIDGSINLASREDQKAKFQALGWQVDSIDGHNVEQIYYALLQAQHATKPVFIACSTTIGKGSLNKAGSERVHGSALGREEVKSLKQNFGFPLEDFAIPAHLLEIWQTAGKQAEKTYRDWQKVAYNIHPGNIDDAIPVLVAQLEKLKNHNEYPDKLEASRAFSGYIITELLKNTDMIITGSADLAISNNMKNNLTKPISREDFSGNFIHYGVREHAMAAVMTGLALYGFLPIGSTFLIFSDYMKPAIRLAAMMKQKVIYIMTHDSIGVGEDGPTHQPVEQLASLRAIPNLLVFRPANFIETIECYKIALNYQGPSVFALTRQAIEAISIDEKDEIVKGAYIVLHETLQESLPESQDQKLDVTIFATGSEVALALKVAKLLQNFSVRVVSVPCLNLFLHQKPDYITSVIGKPKLKVAIEAACSFSWHKLIGESGKFFGVESFGVSAPYKDVYRYFGLEAEQIANILRVNEKLIQYI